MTTRNVPTLYEWTGGAQRIEALFKKFYEHVRGDALLGPVFAEMPQGTFSDRRPLRFRSFRWPQALQRRRKA